MTGIGLSQSPRRTAKDTSSDRERWEKLRRIHVFRVQHTWRIQNNGFRESEYDRKGGAAPELKKMRLGADNQHW